MTKRVVLPVYVTRISLTAGRVLKLLITGFYWSAKLIAIHKEANHGVVHEG